ncbi:MAG TPA: acetate/propionate family kinase [Kofleriaceae bacterium]|nr:acetate/propionate family kinase [Kofleriaceae bacterium]
MRALVLNAGSSTLKWAVLDTAERRALAAGDEPWRAGEAAARAEQVEALLRRVPAFDVAGHRIVHGGLRYTAAAVVDRQVRADLDALAALDPLHMQPALAGVDAVARAAPASVQVAAFDTAFHATMPEAAAGYGLPYAWTERWGLRRFGFHGLSVAYAAGRVRELLGRVPPRTIVCHLGSGCSVTALADGRSVDTTMGFTPLEGVMMATRAGSVDPGLLLHLQARCGVGLDELAEVLQHGSGLLGVSGVSADLREVQAAADGGDPRAKLACERFTLTLRRAVGAMAGVLEGVDAIVFTGGIGEHSARVRGDVAAALRFAGLELDAGPGAADGDRVISTGASAVVALVIAAREDLVILDEVVRLTGPGAGAAPPARARP